MNAATRAAKGLASLIALFLVYEALGYAIDLAGNPWAYGLAGQPAPDGRWRARLAMPPDDAVAPAPSAAGAPNPPLAPKRDPTPDLTLDLTLEPHAVPSMHRRVIDSPPDLVGRLVVCADGRPWPDEGPGRDDTNVQGRTGWLGRDWTFTTAATFGARGGPRSIACRYDGDRLDCRLDFRRSIDPATESRVAAIERKSGRNFRGFELQAVFERAPALPSVSRPGSAATAPTDADRCRAPPPR